jgi:hypothetical protein
MTAWARLLMLATPRFNPVPDLIVGHGVAAVERGDRLTDAGDLPLVGIEIFGDRLGGEKGPRAAGTPGEPLQSFLDVRLDAHGEGG